jgi:hypothetical protein
MSLLKLFNMASKSHHSSIKPNNSQGQTSKLLNGDEWPSQQERYFGLENASIYQS